jgi:hypothetical protein
MSIHAQDQMTISITRSPESSADCVQIHGDVDLTDCRALGLAARPVRSLRDQPSDWSVSWAHLGKTGKQVQDLLLAEAAVAAEGTDRR